MLSNRAALKEINTVNDFLEIYEDSIRIDSKNLLNAEFELIGNRLSQKISPILEKAELNDANEIVQIFKEVYHGKYPYKVMESEQEVRDMISNPKYEWILFKVGINNIVGCVLAELNFKKKKGIMHGFIVRKQYQKIIDALMACIGSITYFWKTYKDKIMVWSAEVRTNDTAPQYCGLMCGIKPIAFLPNKDVFDDKVESDVMIIAYDDRVIKEYRSKDEPRIIRQILDSYVYSSKRYDLGTPYIENPNIVYDPIISDRIREKIEKKIEKDKFGNETIIFSIKDTNSYIKFLYNPYSKNIERTRYEIKNLEELFVLLEEVKKLIQEYEANYFECFVSAYKPTHQKIFHDAGFKSTGYVPCWYYNKKLECFEDRIVFNYYKGSIERDIKLIPEAIELLKEINIIKEKLLPEPLEAIRS